MKLTRSTRKRGFTLLETVIAIGVLAVLLTGFMVVFAPAADGIRKSINVQQADRLASTLEQELVTLHDTTYKTGFDKSFEWIKNSGTAGDALLIYQYRGKMDDLRADDHTPKPQALLKDKLPGKDYVVVPMMRRKSDPKFIDDLTAIEGPVYAVKCTQLIFSNGQLITGKAGTISDPKGTGGAVSSTTDYPEAVIAFAADFHMMPASAPSFFTGAAFTAKFNAVKNPVFSRNIAVRR